MKKLLIALALLAAWANHAQAQLSLEYVTTLSEDDDLTTYTFNDVSIPEDGVLAFMVVARSGSNAALSSLTVDGVAATIRDASSGTTNVGAVVTKEVTAGARDIVLTFSTGMARCGVGVYLVQGSSGEAPVDTFIGQTTSASSRAMTLDFPTGGKAAYGVYTPDASSNTSWSAASEDYDASPEANARFAFAHKTATGAGNTETASWIVAGNEVGVAAVWEEYTASPPTITTSAGQAMQESTRLVATVEATGSPASTWSITGGIDAAFFAIDEDTGALTMPSSANYEDPEDDDANNVYEVEVTATNSEGSDSRLVCVAIRDEW